MKLGMAYREHLAGNRSEHRERAIAAFENALLVWTRERNPEEVTAARANLKAACRDRFYEIIPFARGMFADGLSVDRSGAIRDKRTNDDCSQRMD